MAYFLQVAIGYSLTGLTDEHVLFFLYGLGSNGKTTFLKALRMLFGEYATKTDIEALLAGFANRNTATPYIAALKGIRLAISTEIPEGRRLNESVVKDLTGSDEVTGRYLFSNPFEFEPTHKLWIAGNYKPKIRGNDLGIWRRVRVIPFTVTIKSPRKMSDILAELRAELPGILNWAVLGAIFWHNEGLISPRP